MLSDQGPLKSPAPAKHRPQFFGQRFLLWLAVLAILAAVLIVHAGGVTQRPDPTTAKAQAVLVVIRGTDTSTSGPGIAAFVAVIRPTSRVIGILPVSGDLTSATGVTLAAGAPTLTRQAIATAVSQDLGIKLNGYIVIDAGVVENVLTSLQQDIPAWPANLTPHQALVDLGWPAARPDRKGQIQVISDLISYVPQLQGDATVLAGQVLAGSRTSLSFQELFVLVTYVNDQKVAPIRLKQLPKTLLQKRVKP